MSTDNNSIPFPTPPEGQPSKAELDQIVDGIAKEFEHTGPPPKLEPYKVEVLLQRTIESPGVKELIEMVESEGLGLGPLCDMVGQATRAGGMEGAMITYMMAAWALWRFKQVSDAVTAKQAAKDGPNGPA